MYKMLWNAVKKINTRVDRRRLFILISVLLNAILGLILWLIIGRIYLPQIEWMVCFVGYPAVLAGYIGGITYLYRNT